MSMEQQEQSDKMYAGKFKTVEELEEGYKNSAKVFQENETLKKRIDEISHVPGDYQVPSDVNLHENDIAEVKKVAANSGLTQAQFEKLARTHTAKAKAQLEAFESAKKEVGSDKINILQDFIKNTYPEAVQEIMLNKAIKDKTLRESLFTQRDQALSNGAPGMNRTGFHVSKITYEDVLKAREASMNQKSNVKLRQKYLNLTAAYAHQKDD